jgi:hypothetical protein
VGKSLVLKPVGVELNDLVGSPEKDAKKAADSGQAQQSQTPTSPRDLHVSMIQ